MSHTFRDKFPRDRQRYAKHPHSVVIHRDLPRGCYVFVRDTEGVIHVVRDERHVHPKVLGGPRPATYAGELVIGRRGTIIGLTNLSGTFRFRSRQGLLAVARELMAMGFLIAGQAVVFYPGDGGRPRILRVEK